MFFRSYTKTTMPNTRIRQNIQAIRSTLPEGVTLLCVSKYHTVEDIRCAYEAGERDFGESRLQELQAKAAVLPEDIRWHFIGHLQTNKIKQVLPLVSLIHSIDSLRLAQAVSRTATVPVSVLLEVHVAQEDSKFGFSPAELQSLLKENALQEFPNLRLAGLMGMASLTDDAEQIQAEFGCLKRLFDELKSTYFEASAQHPFDILSMGMSHDYRLALQNGSTLVRIGSAIFS